MTRPAVVVFVKEFVDNFRDRRTLMSALFFGPLFGPALFALITSVLVQKTISDIEKPLEMPVEGAELAPNLIDYLEANNVDVQDPPDDPEAAVKSGRHDVVLVIPDDYPEHVTSGQSARLALYADNSNSSAAKNIGRAQALLDGYNRRLGLLRLQARGISPQVVHPVAVEAIDVSTPAARSVLILGMTSYFILFAILMGGMYLATDTTAGERERGSLEPLLTLPVSRATLIVGKLAATCAYMILSLALTLAAFGVSLAFVPLEEFGMTANFGPAVALKVFGLMLPFVLLGAGLLTAVASFTRSYKEAQTYLSVVMLIPTLPIIFAAVTALKPSLPLMGVPSLAQHLLITDLIKGEAVRADYALVATVATLAAGLGLAWIAARLYRREGILG